MFLKGRKRRLFIDSALSDLQRRQEGVLLDLGVGNVLEEHYDAMCYDGLSFLPSFVKF